MFRKFTYFALILALCAIVLGSYVRLSNAGLGCPDWPGCYGQLFISDSGEFKQQAGQVFPESPLDTEKAWKELSHRYIAALLGCTILLLTLISWREKHCRTVTVTTSVVLLLMVAGQAALGMLTVSMKMMPIIVTSHLLMGMLTFWLLFWLYLRVKPGVSQRPVRSGPSGLAVFAMIILFIQIFIGGWTSTNLAGLACADFPQCHGHWLPQIDYPALVNNFTDLLSDGNAELSFDTKVFIHWLHRAGALITVVILVFLALISVIASNPKQVKFAGISLILVLLIEVSLGIITVKLGLPIWSAVAHTGFSACLMLPLIYIQFYSRNELPAKTIPDVQLETQPVEHPDVVESAVAVDEIYSEPEPETLYLRLKNQLKKTRTGLGHSLVNVSFGQKTIDADLLEDIEASLLMADVGIDATTEIINHLSENVQRGQLNDANALSAALKQQLIAMLEPCNQPLHIPDQEGPFVILVVGVNGVGKTTTIGKLAKRLQAQGHSVMLAAGDTFRAAAVEQLQVWGERNNIHVVAQHTGADSASVIYDGVQSAHAKDVDILIADTAGRLHTKSNLMDELKKIKRIIGKLDEHAPHEVLLVLDSGTGQNALSQTRQFNETVKLTGLALTKLDGTAKGGVIFALAAQFGIPIRYIGIGEGIDDLQDFHAEQFVEALFVSDE